MHTHTHKNAIRYEKSGSRDLEDVQIARTYNIIVNMPSDRLSNAIETKPNRKENETLHTNKVNRDELFP